MLQGKAGTLRANGLSESSSMLGSERMLQMAAVLRDTGCVGVSHALPPTAHQVLLPTRLIKWGCLMDKETQVGKLNNDPACKLVIVKLRVQQELSGSRAGRKSLCCSETGSRGSKDAPFQQWSCRVCPCVCAHVYTCVGVHKASQLCYPILFLLC